MIKYVLFLIGLFFFFVFPVHAQEEIDEASLSFSGYIEIYYLNDFSNPPNHERPSFVYSFNRHNEFSLNLGLIRGFYNTEKIRANLGLMAGTYPNANLAAEPGVLKNIFEANIGIRLFEGRDIWLEAGIFPSHIGFESAIGKDCWTLTRSVLADNSPYYESGIKISYSSDDNLWILSGMILNGWQRIQRVEGNQTPAFGHQVQFTPNDRVTLNSSSFIGSDRKDSKALMRYFHNFYGIFQIHPAIGVTVGFDMGIEEAPGGTDAIHIWYSPVAIGRFAINERVHFAARSEYYSDRSGVIIATGTTHGFKTLGYSANLDYQVSEEVLWRVEARGFISKDKVFENKGGDPGKNNFFVAASLSLSL